MINSFIEIEENRFVNMNNVLEVRYNEKEEILYLKDGTYVISVTSEVAIASILQYVENYVYINKRL